MARIPPLATAFFWFRPRPKAEDGRENFPGLVGQIAKTVQEKIPAPDFRGFLLKIWEGMGA